MQRQVFFLATLQQHKTNRLLFLSYHIGMKCKYSLSYRLTHKYCESIGNIVHDSLFNRGYIFQVQDCIISHHFLLLHSISAQAKGIIYYIYLKYSLLLRKIYYKSLIYFESLDKSLLNYYIRDKKKVKIKKQVNSYVLQFRKNNDETLDTNLDKKSSIQT